MKDHAVIFLDENQDGTWTLAIEGNFQNEANNLPYQAALSRAKDILNNTARGGDIIKTNKKNERKIIDCWK